jgi:Fe-Mn family superoxide dismutase
MTHTYEEKKFACMDKELDGISKTTNENHYKLYQGYVKKANEILAKLKDVDLDPTKSNQTYSEIRELKVEYSFAVGGIKNHELYFGHLGGNGSPPKGKIMELIERDFGSYDDWKADLKATGMAARGWAWLGYDWKTMSLFNYIGDAQNTYPVWGVSPLIALDVYEHAYWGDFGTKRADYIDAFFKNLDWKTVMEMVERNKIT